MDNSVTISKNKENILEFEVDIQGVDTFDMSVRFIIETDRMKLGFDSIKQDDKKWYVKIPALSILNADTYPFHIDITVDGYHFMPLVGNIKVVESESIKISKPENLSLSPSAKSLDDIINTTKPKIISTSEENSKTEEVSEVKPESKFKMEPVEVKNSGQLFKTIADISNSTKDNKTEMVDVKPEPKKATVVGKEKKKIDKKKKENKEEKKPIKETNIDDIKTVAKNILQDVTGLGKPKETITEDVSKHNNDKIKNILKEETIESTKPKVKEAGAIKKITKDKKVIEVNKTKEDSIKKVLEENTNTDDVRSVTTIPFKKKDTTIH